jgi:YbgC/YbaW family acyl-CoA thioester hydrolase
LATSEFRYRRRVQFPETDLSGIVHFSCFFRYVEEAEHAMWRSVGLSVAPPGSAIGWPRVAASFEYRKPLRFEDEFEVHLQITAIARKTITYKAVLRKGDEILATGSLTIICVLRRPGEPLKAADIPSDIASRFAVASDVAPAAGSAANSTAPARPRTPSA